MGRSQKVFLNGNISESVEINTGVPQGSILGPILFTIYTCHILDKSLQHCHYHLYADDTQLYVSFHSDDLDTTLNNIQSDLNNLIKICNKHSLHINPIKSNVMLFGGKAERALVVDKIKLYLDNNLLLLKDEVKSLGVVLDASLRFKTHINICIGRAYSSLKLIYSSRQFLNKTVKTMLCDLLVLSQFNYADALYTHCIDSKDSKRIQLVQNNCLRLIHGIRKYEHISHKLKETGWLNMYSRRKLHTAVLYYKIIANKLPKYLTRKITYRTDVHNLNLRHRGLLTIPHHRTSLFERCFTYNICIIYNNFPENIRNTSVTNFKNSYKQFLLEQAG